MRHYVSIAVFAAHPRSYAIEPDKNAVAIDMRAADMRTRTALARAPQARAILPSHPVDPMRAHAIASARRRAGIALPGPAQVDACGADDIATLAACADVNRAALRDANADSRPDLVRQNRYTRARLAGA
ncbi:hypothetical protein ASE35_09920 [Lysobacter sp. Root916]|uniref:hypothetical protein n=1 Tax=Lysobacter sp. Root916 TaxID=1736606 RepID=UPI00070CE723|nr:hypothetical protein [Lysobacter sp. Root916]KRD34055.1 hypothetical protein ASE35_09920 [Lysobacter sp. Root916]